MNTNPIILLPLAWAAGILLGVQSTAPASSIPTLITLIGFMVIAALTSVLYFGKLSALTTFFLGIAQAGLFLTFPLSGILLGACTIASSLYGRTLGDLALDDFYENGNTHLPGYTFAAFLNFLLIVIFVLVVWFLFPILPNAEQLIQWFPLIGWGV